MEHVSQTRLGACRYIEFDPSVVSEGVGIGMIVIVVGNMSKGAPAEICIPTIANRV